MPVVIFELSDGSKREIEASVGDTVLDVAHSNNIPLEGACEGSLACSTCHVIVSEEDYDLLPPASEDEEDMLDMAFGLTVNSRLGCQIVISEGLKSLKVRVPRETRNIQQEKK